MHSICLDTGVAKESGETILNSQNVCISSLVLLCRSLITQGIGTADVADAVAP